MEELRKGTNVIIVNDFDYIQGGASKVAIDTANLLVESKEQLNVYFFSGVHGNSSNLNKNITRICTNQGEALKNKNKIKGFINGLYNFKAKSSMKKLLNSLDRENTIIHVHGWTKSLSSSIFDIAFKKNFKVVVTLHDYFTACPNGGYFNYKKNEICYLKPLSWKCIKCNCDSRNYLFKLYRLLRQFVQMKIVKLNDRLENVITISDFQEKILKNTLNNKTKIFRVANSIDVNKNIKKSNDSLGDYYLYVGRIDKTKGVDIFCESMKKTGLKGIVVGDGEEKEYYSSKYQNVEFVGWKNPDEVKQYMKNAIYLIFPSRIYECSPLTTMEALAVGLPCIVSKNCAAIDQIEDRKNGYSFETVDELCEILKNKPIPKFNFNYYNKYSSEIIGCYKEIL